MLAQWIVATPRVFLAVLRWLRWRNLRTRITSHPREARGYLVWIGFAGIIGFAIPEITSAAGHAVWPTVSGTVGGIENRHDWFALIVVVVLVFGAMHAIRVHFTRDHVLARGGTRSPSSPRLIQTEDGRLTRADDVQDVSWWWYYGAAFVVILGVSFGVHYGADVSSQVLGEFLYGLIGLFLFLVPGLLAYEEGKLVPFPTLFWTIQRLERHSRVVALVFAGGITILLIHLVFYPWPSIIPDIQGVHSYCNPSHGKPPAAPLCQTIHHTPVSPHSP
jgi:hypothetical protein